MNKINWKLVKREKKKHNALFVNQWLEEMD